MDTFSSNPPWRSPHAGMNKFLTHRWLETHRILSARLARMSGRFTRFWLCAYYLYFKPPMRAGCQVSWAVLYRTRHPPPPRQQTSYPQPDVLMTNMIYVEHIAVGAWNITFLQVLIHRWCSQRWNRTKCECHYSDLRTEIIWSLHNVSMIWFEQQFMIVLQMTQDATVIWYILYCRQLTTLKW